VHYLFYKDGIHTFHLFNQRKIGLQLMLDMCAFIHGHYQNTLDLLEPSNIYIYIYIF
jgi:hypothetical protein